MTTLDLHSAPPVQQVAPLGEAHRDAVCALFMRVFGHTLSPQEWNWKYLHGHGAAVGLFEQGELLAHYGGLSRQVVFEGQRVMACQVVDAMVDPRSRRALARRGPIFQVTTRFLETQIGAGLPHLIGYGFPTVRAGQVAAHLGLYGVVDSMHCASWSAAVQGTKTAVCSNVADNDLVDGGAWASVADNCWAAMSSALVGCTVGVRDRPWLRHRYFAHPRFEYQVAMLRSRWLRRPLGLVVTRRHDSHLEWVDVVASPRHWPTLLGAVRHMAHEQGLARVEAWMTDSHRHLLNDLAADVSWRSLDIDVPANAHNAGPSPDQLRGKWVLMSGDTDFR